MQPPFRVGTGHDVHRLAEGHALVLGGVHVPSAVGFDTHSDGDVLSHALVDALAGAIADGDLGTHFPEDDPEAQDARSLDFIRHLVQRIRAQDYEIANVDSFVVLGTTRLRPHLDGMRRDLADALGVDVQTGLGEGAIQQRPRREGRGPGVRGLGNGADLPVRRLTPAFFTSSRHRRS